MTRSGSFAPDRSGSAPVGGVVVTGGGRGIGAACAVELAHHGYRVVVLEAASVTDLPPGISVVAGDTTVESDVREACRLAAEESGVLAGAVANAGFARPAVLAEQPDADWEAVLSVNLGGTRLLGRVALEYAARPGFAFVGMASFAGMFGMPGYTAYGPTKAGVAAMMRVWAVEWAGWGGRANAVAPGFIDTPLFAAAVARGDIDPVRFEARVPSGRLGTAEQVARVVRFLVSPDSDYVTGATVPVDGGASIMGP